MAYNEALRTMARTKANSRLKPAKDIHIQFSELLSSTNQENIPQLKNKLIMTIDSAEAEYKILTREVDVIKNMIQSMENEMQECDNQFRSLQDEMIALEHEKERVDQEKVKLKELNEMKTRLYKAKVPSIKQKTSEGATCIENTIKSIEDKSIENRIRDLHFTQIMKSMKSFLNPKESDLEEIIEESGKDLSDDRFTSEDKGSAETSEKSEAS